MKSHRTIFAIMLVACVALAGCRSHRHLAGNDAPRGADTSTVAPPNAGKPRAERLDSIAGTEYRTLMANFKCSVRGIAVNGQMRLLRDSIVWVSVNKVVELGRAQATPSRVQAYLKLMGKRYDMGYGDLKRNWGIDADFATLQALLVGNCPPQCRKSKEPQRQGDTVTLWLSQNGGARQLTLKKDYATCRILGADLTSKAAGQRVTLTYGERQNVGGRLVPSHIEVKISSKQLNEQAVIRLERITVDEPLTFPFKMQ